MSLPLASSATSDHLESLPQTSKPTDPYEAAWKRVKARLDNMTKEESLQTFVRAGILTEKGNVRKSCKGVFVPVKK